jgi:tRNA-dihydrouridine synthase B
MCEAAEIAESAKPEFLDINCGCWVKNVVARQAGAALLKEPDTMVAMADALVKRSSLPVTLKTRLGWNKQSIIIIELAKKLEQTGIAALCVHCRTRDMGHSGEADWDWIYKLKQEVSMPIILNGDVRSPQDAKTAFDNTGCDAVMVGRGAIGNPFVFRQIQKYLATGELEPEPDIDERIEYCLRHLQLSIEYKGDVYGVKEFRKYYTGYLKGLYSAASVRRDVVIMDSYNAIEERLLEYQEFYHNRYAESFVQPQTDINLQANIAL